MSNRLRNNFTSGAAVSRAVPIAVPVAQASMAPATEAAHAGPAEAVRAVLRLHAAPHGSARSVHAFILFLDWFGEP